MRRNCLIYSQRDLGQSEIQGHTASELQSWVFELRSSEPRSHPLSTLSFQQQLCGKSINAGPSPTRVHKRSPTCHLACWSCIQREGYWRNWCSHQPAGSHLMSSLDHEWHMRACRKRREYYLLFMLRTLAGRDPPTPRRSEDRSRSCRQSWYLGSHGIHSRWTITFFFSYYHNLRHQSVL